jgi:hypothetical protein
MMDSEVSEMNSLLALMFAPFSTRNSVISRWSFWKAMKRLVTSCAELWVSTCEGSRSFMAGYTSSIDICTFLNQELHNVEATILRSNPEDGSSIDVWYSTEHVWRIKMSEPTTGIDICTFLNQELYNFKATFLRGNEKASESIQSSNWGEHLSRIQMFNGKTYHRCWYLRLSQPRTSQPPAAHTTKLHKGWCIRACLKFRWIHMKDSGVSKLNSLLALRFASFSTRNFTTSRWPPWEAM